MLRMQDDDSIWTGHGPVAGSVKPMNRATASMVDSVLDWTVFFRVCVLAPDLGGVLLGVFCISIRCRSLQLSMTSRKAMCVESSNLKSTMLE